MSAAAVRSHIPWAEPRYWGREETYALDALRSSWISGGPFVDRLEAEFASYVGAPHVVATSNGTTAIHAAYLALGVEPGDEIICPAFAFQAAANVAMHMGATPVFADVDPDTWCLAPAAAEAAVTERTVGIVAVHTYGGLCDMAGLQQLADARGLWLMEDAAEAIGSAWAGRQAGTIAEIGTYSFHATKTITTGEGGAVATRRADWDAAMRLYRSHGVAKRRYWHDVAGHNFRLTNVQAAIGCGQLEQADAIRRERERVQRRYAERLRGLNGARPQQFGPAVDALVWTVGLELDPNAYPQGRDAVMARLGEAGIETRNGFHAASEMRHLYERAPPAPVAERLARQVISLPSSPTVSDAEIDHIVDRLAALQPA